MGSGAGGLDSSEQPGDTSAVSAQPTVDVTGALGPVQTAVNNFAANTGATQTDVPVRSQDRNTRRAAENTSKSIASLRAGSDDLTSVGFFGAGNAQGNNLGGPGHREYDIEELAQDAPEGEEQIDEDVRAANPASDAAQLSEGRAADEDLQDPDNIDNPTAKKAAMTRETVDTIEDASNEGSLVKDIIEGKETKTQNDEKDVGSRVNV